MSTPDIVLHQWTISPFCGKIRKVLDLKGLPYRIVEYGGLRGIKARSLSSSGKLPVLDYDGVRIQDSSAIARLLDERHPDPSLMPAGVDRHLAHLLEDWADESLYWFQLWARLYDPEALDRAVSFSCEGRPAYERVLFKHALLRYRRWVVAQGLGRYPRESVLENLRGHLTALEGRLTGSSGLAGDAVSIADIAAAAQLDELVRTSPLASEIRERPRLSAWLDRCQFPSRSVEKLGQRSCAASGPAVSEPAPALEPPKQPQRGHEKERDHRPHE
jgi:glutathione S-transferase